MADNNNTAPAEVIELSHKEFLRIDRDYEKAAKVASLVYVRPDSPGIVRVKKGQGFTYIYDEKPLKGKDQIERIKKLAIPPAWTNVWICPLPNGHIQATGFDMRQRNNIVITLSGILCATKQNFIGCTNLEKHYPKSVRV